MSLVSNRHNVNPFVSGKSQALTGQRLAKIIFNKTKDNPNPLQSVCVSIPQVQPGEYRPEYESIIRNALENAQDKIIKSLYESSDGALTNVSDDDISVDACLAYLAAGGVGKLSAEKITAWFNLAVKDNATVLIAEKLGFQDMTDAQCAVIEKQLNGYRGLFTMLASKDPCFDKRQLKGMRTLIDVSSIEDAMHAKLCSRLQELQPVEEVLEF